MTEHHSSGSVSIAALPAPPPVPRRLDQYGGVPPPPPPPVSPAPPPQQPQQRETQRAQRAYNGFEVAEDGTYQELNYLVCNRGDMIQVLTEPFAGHTANRFSMYVYGQCGDHIGWVPEAVLTDENDDDEKNWRIEAGLWGVDQAVASASSAGDVSAAAVACPQTAEAACPPAAFIVLMRPHSSQSLSEAACPQAAAAACRNDSWQ